MSNDFGLFLLGMVFLAPAIGTLILQAKLKTKVKGGHVRK